MTIGTVCVVFFAAIAAGEIGRHDRGTFKADEFGHQGGQANPTDRQPIASRSPVDRQSIVTSLPSAYPGSRSPWRNASVRAVIDERGAALRNPMRGSRAGCWGFDDRRSREDAESGTPNERPSVHHRIPRGRKEVRPILRLQRELGAAKE